MGMPRTDRSNDIRAQIESQQAGGETGMYGGNFGFDPNSDDWKSIVSQYNNRDQGGGGGYRSADFQDYNNNGIDDRDEQGGGGNGYPPSGNGQDSYNPWNVGMPPTSSGYSWNGTPTSGARAGDADYEGVQDFSDAAYDNARRYLDPQQSFDNRRFDQELINRGVDPNSAQGQQMYQDMMRAHGDQDQGAAFGAMEFGQGIQEQMFRQNFDNTRQAGDMQQASWNNDINRGNLQLGRQQQDFNEYLGYDNIDFRNEAYNEGNRRYDQQYQDDMIRYFMEYGQNGGVNQSGAGGGSGTSPLSPWGDYFSDMREKWEF